ncbi:vigilin [Nephila pilipes]|uniref:Vigilin n=1 Tax=Nephila pilipes TaxID=299642 RepID=A0A8X6T2T4_NEPPI|nr:vigilin [Nephila pilipes]
MYHPFIIGPFNETVNQIIKETKIRINIPPASVMKNELTIAGEKEAVANYIIGPPGQNIQEILQETNVSFDLPPPDVQSDTITLRGEQAKLDPALTLVYSKANSVKTEYMDIPSWLHKYIIGKKDANIKHVTRDLSKVQVKAFK